MKCGTETIHEIEPLDGELKLAAANRARLARYLEFPSAAEVDEITAAEIHMLDERRGELLRHWSRAILFPVDRIDGASIALRGAAAPLECSSGFADLLQQSSANSVIISAFTLGEQVDQRVQEHLRRRELFEAFVLKQWASTMAEQARVALTQRLESWVRGLGCSLLPYDGPGYNGWPLEGLRIVLELVYGTNNIGVGRPIQVTDSGLLLPVNSMALVYGVMSGRAEASDRDRLAQCRRCDMPNCRYRIFESEEGR